MKVTENSQMLTHVTIYILLLLTIMGRCKCSIVNTDNKLGQIMYRRAAMVGIVCSFIQLGQPSPSEANILDKISHISRIKSATLQSKGWELARQKRSAAIKAMQLRGILKVDTDETGNQFLSLPWIPDRKIPYKSLSLKQRLVNEVCAVALGEISKDALLYAVDTAKTRRQAQGNDKNKKVAFDAGSISPLSVNMQEEAYGETVHRQHAEASEAADRSPVLAQQNDIKVVREDNAETTPSAVDKFLALYAGFSIVAFASIPQGGSFFFVRKGLVEVFATQYPTAPPVLSGSIPIILGVMVYWLFRTPAEVIKTQVQTGQYDSIRTALSAAVGGDITVESSAHGEIAIPLSTSSADRGVLSLWRRYPVMLSLDIPFQLINFVLYGCLSEAVFGPQSALHWEQSVWTRLVCGVLCGVASAAVTCPLDVCKTRIIAREKNRSSTLVQPVAERATLVDGASSLESGQHDNQTEGSPALSTVTGDDVASATSADNIASELVRIVSKEGAGALFLGLGQRLVYTGLANGIRLAAYGTSRMDLMMRSLDRL
jgi:hypothetical protein